MKTKKELRQLLLVVILKLAIFIPILGAIYWYDTKPKRPSKIHRYMPGNTDQVP